MTWPRSANLRSAGAEPLEYIVSLDSRPNVTSAVPRSWLSLTLDQAALVRERRQPSLGQLAVGSPSRHLSLGQWPLAADLGLGPRGALVSNSHEGRLCLAHWRERRHTKPAIKSELNFVGYNSVHFI